MKYNIQDKNHAKKQKQQMLLIKLFMILKHFILILFLDKLLNKHIFLTKLK